jgi:hypothetical protein
VHEINILVGCVRLDTYHRQNFILKFDFWNLASGMYANICQSTLIMVLVGLMLVLLNKNLK